MTKEDAEENEQLTKIRLRILEAFALQTIPRWLHSLLQPLESSTVQLPSSQLLRSLDGIRIRAGIATAAREPRMAPIDKHLPQPPKKALEEAKKEVAQAGIAGRTHCWHAWWNAAPAAHVLPSVLIIKMRYRRHARRAGHSAKGHSATLALALALPPFLA